MSSVNVTTWNNDQRRTSSFVVLAMAIVIVLGALAAWYFLSSTPAWVYWALVGALALVLIFMAVLLFVPAREPGMAATMAAEAEAAAPAASMAAEPEQAVAAPAAFEPRVLTLRCGDCGTIFEVTDTGERPLYHTCPGCGAEGALRDEPIAAAPPEPASEPAPEIEAPQPAPMAPAEPEEAPFAMAPPAPVKKIKLRCGGCKEVFSIEDTGERPLKRACPHCGRMGQIN